MTEVYAKKGSFYNSSLVKFFRDHGKELIIDADRSNVSEGDFLYRLDDNDMLVVTQKTKNGERVIYMQQVFTCNGNTFTWYGCGPLPRVPFEKYQVQESLPVAPLPEKEMER